MCFNNCSELSRVMLAPRRFTNARLLKPLAILHSSCSGLETLQPVSNDKRRKACLIFKWAAWMSTSRTDHCMSFMFYRFLRNPTTPPRFSNQNCGKGGHNHGGAR